LQFLRAINLVVMEETQPRFRLPPRDDAIGEE
jgi:hypothetical protein